MHSLAATVPHIYPAPPARSLLVSQLHSHAPQEGKKAVRLSTERNSFVRLLRGMLGAYVFASMAQRPIGYYTLMDNLIGFLSEGECRSYHTMNSQCR
jgi:hypothetical protein